MMKLISISSSQQHHFTSSSSLPFLVMNIIIILLLVLLSAAPTLQQQTTTTTPTQQQSPSSPSSSSSFKGCSNTNNNGNGNGNSISFDSLPICLFSMGNWGDANENTVGRIGQSIANLAWLGSFTVDAEARREIETDHNRQQDDGDNNNNPTNTSTTTTTASPSSSSSSSDQPSSTTSTNITTTTVMTTIVTSATTATTTSSTISPPPSPSTSPSPSENNNNNNNNNRTNLCCRFTNIFALGNNFNPRGVSTTTDPLWSSVLVHQFKNATIDPALLTQIINDYNESVNFTFGVEAMKTFLLNNPNPSNEKLYQFLLELAASSWNTQFGPGGGVGGGYPQTMFKKLSPSSSSSISGNNNNNNNLLNFIVALGPHDGGLNSSEFNSRNFVPNTTRQRAQINYGEQIDPLWTLPQNYYKYDVNITISNSNNDSSSSTTPDDEKLDLKDYFLRTIVLDTTSLKFNCPTELEIRKERSDANNISISSANKYKFPPARLAVCREQRRWFEELLEESDENSTIAAVIVLGHSAIAGPQLVHPVLVNDSVSTIINLTISETTDLQLDHYLVPLLKRHRVAAYISAGTGSKSSSSTSTSSSSSASSTTNPNNNHDPHPANSQVTSIALERNLTTSLYESGGLAYIVNGQATLTKNEALHPNRTCKFLEQWSEPKERPDGSYDLLSKSTFAQISQNEAGSSCVGDGYYFTHYIQYSGEDEKTNNNNASSNNNNNNQQKQRVPIGFIHCAMNHSGIAVSCRSVLFRKHIEGETPVQTQLLGLLWLAFFATVIAVGVLACYTKKGRARDPKKKKGSSSKDKKKDKKKKDDDDDDENEDDDDKGKKKSTNKDDHDDNEKENELKEPLLVSHQREDEELIRKEKDSSMSSLPETNNMNSKTQPVPIIITTASVSTSSSSAAPAAQSSSSDKKKSAIALELLKEAEEEEKEKEIKKKQQQQQQQLASNNQNNNTALPSSETTAVTCENGVCTRKVGAAGDGGAKKNGNSKKNRHGNNNNSNSNNGGGAGTEMQSMPQFEFSPTEKEVDFKFDEMLKEEKESKYLHSSSSSPTAASNNNNNNKRKPNKHDEDI